MPQPALHVGDDITMLDGLTAIQVLPRPVTDVNLSSLLQEPTIIVFVRNFA
jgi:hypothetical protein